MRKIRVLNIFFIILFTLIFVFSVFKIASYFNEVRLSKKLYNDIANNFVTIEESESIDSVVFDVDFDALKAKNDDVVGWIYLPDSPINYPVLQGEDNNQYLRRLLDGKYNNDGSIFVDYRNAELKQDMNYIIYGHNMKSGSMFSYLEKYNSQDFYDANPVIYYLTPECKYVIKLYAGFVTSTDSESFLINSEEELFIEYMKTAKEKSTFNSNVEYTPGQSVVTLSTCYSKNDRYRYIVLGLLEECVVK